MQRKLSQIKAMILVAVLELEKLELSSVATPRKKRERKPPHVELKLIQGGKG
nr:hypothetical protein BdHM001_18290 [Bdellovibrio sp. HM001]